MFQKSQNTIKVILFSLAIILLVGSISACGSAQATLQAEAAPTPASQAAVVSAEAFVVPVKKSNLAFEVSGQVAAIEVQEGDQVSAGQTLARLDDASQQAALKQAQAGLANADAALAQAQASLAQTKAGARPEEIAQAEAALAKAEAALASNVSGPTQEEIAQAEARVESAQASLKQVLAGNREEDKKAASARMLQAEANVRLAQADYDKNVYGDPKIAEPFGVALQQATLEYEAAKAEYDKVMNGSTQEQIDVARASVKEAQAALAKTKAGATPQQIAQAQAEVARAQAALAQTKGGATKEQVAITEAGVQVAQAGVQNAEAGVLSAETVLAKTELKAPFSGTVGSLNIELGEIVSAGAPVMTLGDTSRWQVETDDLTELDVVKVKIGAKVTIKVDALPNQEFVGQVARITPKSVTKSGDVTYTVLIDITKGDTSKLRWGMTTFVDIETGPEL